MSEQLFNELIKLPKNSILNHNKDLFIEWDFERNDDLGFDIYKATKGQKNEVWWRCRKCESKYDMRICDKVYKNCGCPYCAGKRVNHTNSLATLQPELVSQGHQTKNGELTPHDVVCGSQQKAWWVCKLGHEWDARIYDRVYKDSDCSFCNGNLSILVGYNDMWTTNPELASLLANPDDGYKYKQTSGKKADWKCPDCGKIIKNKKISNIHNYGLSCSSCSDGKSYAEKFMSNLLSYHNLKFESERIFKWSHGKRYDFYVINENIIIEMHGGQHYKEYEDIHWKTDVCTVMENDRLKEKLAKESIMLLSMLDILTL